MVLSENLKQELSRFLMTEPLPLEFTLPYLMHFSRYDLADLNLDGTISDYPFSVSRWGEEANNGKLYHDTHQSFVLKKDNNPYACIGFLWKNEPTTWSGKDRYKPDLIKLPDDTLLVVQLQAYPNMAEKERNEVRWERMLLAMTVDWAYQTGFSKAAVLPAKRNEWSKVNRTDNGRMRYDITAEREGFRFDKELDLFIRELP